MSITNKAMAVFTAAMTLAALVFWIAVAFAGSTREVIAGIDITVMVLFTMAHLPAMAAAILLWRAGLFRDRRPARAGLLMAACYFSAACIIAVFGNALAASVLGMIGQ